MLVQLYHPKSLSPARLDKYLANGWFRSGNMLYRSQLICLENDIYNTVNIRLKLDQYTTSKSQRRIKSKIEGKYTTEIKKACITPEKEELYRRYRHRFKGFLLDSLENYMNSGFKSSIFNTYELAVYDNKKLIALSFFDIGNFSISSQIGLFDWDYEKLSLGKYTMLKEIEFGLQNNFKFYYPGYVLHKSSMFDYKLSLGSFHYYNWNGRWKKMTSHANYEGLIIHEFNQKNEEIKKLIKSEEIDFKEFLYPLFSFGFVNFFSESFLKAPKFIALGDWNQPYFLSLSYDVNEKGYYLYRVGQCPEYNDLFLMEYSKDFESNKSYMKNLLRIVSFIGFYTKVGDLVNAIKTNH